MTTFACDYYDFAIPDAHVGAVLDMLGEMPNPSYRATVADAILATESGQTVTLPVPACDALLDAYAAWERDEMDGATE